MSESPGKFSSDAVAANELHQRTVGKEPLPDKIEYEVPGALAKQLRPTSKNDGFPPARLTIANRSTLVERKLASLIYMDVGRWSGGAPTEKDTDAHWGRRRDFGIVFGRLAALCSYTTDPPPDSKFGATYGGIDPRLRISTEFKDILPLLDHLSSNPALGRVQVTKAVLGNPMLATPPKDDRIYVILGDLHAPVVTERNRAQVDGPPERSLADRLGAVQSVPGLLNPGVQAELVRAPSHSFLGWHGRYDPGTWAREILPIIAPVLGESAKAIVGARPLVAKAAAAAAGALGAAALLKSPVTTAASLAFGAVVTDKIANEIRTLAELRHWPDPAQGEIPVVDGWFEQYHGTLKKKGADIFQDAGEDLTRWLDLLRKYRAENLGPKPIRLVQLGDLFDFWIGLKYPFDIDKGAEHVGNFPDVAAARAFLKFWLDESLRNESISYLWNFDRNAPTADPSLQTVFLYGNHDTYMGTLLDERHHGHKPLPGRFDEDRGLIVQHGHQEDFFNTERTAGLGYLLTQAVFSDNYVRTMEDPMGSIAPKLFGGTWTRLGLAEMALKACIFDRVLGKGKQAEKPAMTFVMGHTHESVLQVIDVVRPAPLKEPPDRHTSVETEP